MTTKLTVSDPRFFTTGTGVAVVHRRWWKRRTEAIVLGREGNELTLGEVRLESRWHFVCRTASEALYNVRRRLSDWVAP